MKFYYKNLKFDTARDAVEVAIKDDLGEVKVMVYVWLSNWPIEDVLDSIIDGVFQNITLADLAEDCVRSDSDYMEEGSVGPISWGEEEEE